MKALFLKIALFLGLIGQTPDTPPLPERPPLNEIKPYSEPLQADEPIETTQSTALATTSPELGGETKPTCSCVEFARKITGYTVPKVQSAKNLTITRFEPRPDYWVIFNSGGIYGKHGHVAVITSVATSTFNVVEYNLKPCKKTWRTIQKDDPFIRGYFGVD